MTQITGIKYSRMKGHHTIALEETDVIDGQPQRSWRPIYDGDDAKEADRIYAEGCGLVRSPSRAAFVEEPQQRRFL